MGWIYFGKVPTKLSARVLKTALTAAADSSGLSDSQASKATRPAALT